ncbi:hypothetical protein C1646_731665, partial [Rhizophagus diaphanus]
RCHPYLPPMDKQVFYLLFISHYILLFITLSLDFYYYNYFFLQTVIVLPYFIIISLIPFFL